MIKAVDDIEHRALAGAVRADNRANFTLLDIKTDVVQDFHDPEREADILNPENLATEPALIHAAASWARVLTG